MAANPLSSTEIYFWQRRQRIRFDPFEESVIDRLDTTFLQANMKKAT